MKILCLHVTLWCATVINAWAGINEWTYVGLAPEEIKSIAVHPTNPDIIYASALDVFWDSTREGGLFKSTNHGLTWDTLGFRNSNVHKIAIDRLQPETIWVADDTTGAWRSTDGGSTWQNRSTGLIISPYTDIGVENIAVSPYASDLLLCGLNSIESSRRGYISHTSGEQWTYLNTLGPSFLRFIEFDADSTSIIYCMNEDSRYLRVSRDSGTTFVDVDTGPFVGAYDLRACPERGQCLIWTTIMDGVRRTTDAGLTWQPAITRYVNTDTVIWNTDVIGIGDTIALATNDGPFMAVSGGNQILDLTANMMPGEPIDLIKVVSRAPLEIWAMRRQQGLWTFTLYDSLSTRRFSENSRQTNVKLFPNPSSGLFTIVFPRPVQGAELKVYDVLGRIVPLEMSLNATDRAGLTLDRALPVGNYFVMITTQSSLTSVIRVAIIK